jgi:hypothetical protein
VPSRSFPQRQCPQTAFRDDNNCYVLDGSCSTTHRSVIPRDSSFVLLRIFAVSGNFGIDLATNAITSEYLIGATQAAPRSRNSWHFCNFTISHGPGQEPAIIPSKSTPHGGNQDAGSRTIKPRIFASNGGFFARNAACRVTNLMTKKADLSTLIHAIRRQQSTVNTFGK